MNIMCLSVELSAEDAVKSMSSEFGCVDWHLHGVLPFLTEYERSWLGEHLLGNTLRIRGVRRPVSVPTRPTDEVVAKAIRSVMHQERLKAEEEAAKGERLVLEALSAPDEKWVLRDVNGKPMAYYTNQQMLNCCGVGGDPRIEARRQAVETNFLPKLLEAWDEEQAAKYRETVRAREQEKVDQMLTEKREAQLREWVQFEESFPSNIRRAAQDGYPIYNDVKVFVQGLVSARCRELVGDAKSVPSHTYGTKDVETVPSKEAYRRLDALRAGIDSIMKAARLPDAVVVVKDPMVLVDTSTSRSAQYEMCIDVHVVSEIFKGLDLGCYVRCEEVCDG